MRQPVHQIDVDGANAFAPERIDCRLGCSKALIAADGRLHLSVEILHADGDPGHACFTHGIDTRSIDVAGIDLHREFRRRADVEAAAELGGQHLDVAWREDIRRPAAPVDVRHPVPRRDERGDVRNLGDQGMQVVRDRSVAQRSLGAAPAVPAEAVAKGDVHIKGQLGAIAQGSQPSHIVQLTDARREIRCGGVARVARHRRAVFLDSLRLHPLFPPFCASATRAAHRSQGTSASVHSPQLRQRMTAARRPLGRHDPGLQLGEIRRGQNFARARQQHAAFPPDMAALGFEKAA